MPAEAAAAVPAAGPTIASEEVDAIAQQPPASAAEVAGLEANATEQAKLDLANITSLGNLRELVVHAAVRGQVPPEGWAPVRLLRRAAPPADGHSLRPSGGLPDFA